jgi:four helix bundle protein
MPIVNRFEDLEAWKMARNLTRAVYRCTRTRSFDDDRDLRKQIRRAAVSAMSNIAEGFDRGTRTEFIYFLRISKGSVGEVQSQLYVALDENYINQTEFKIVKELSDSTKKLIAGFMHYLKKPKNSEGQILVQKPTRRGATKPVNQ